MAVIQIHLVSWVLHLIQKDEGLTWTLGEIATVIWP